MGLGSPQGGVERAPHRPNRHLAGTHGKDLLCDFPSPGKRYHCHICLWFNRENLGPVWNERSHAADGTSWSGL